MVRRLLATYLTITALTLAVVVVPLGRVFADREESRLTMDIERDAQAVASLVEDALEAGFAPHIARTLADYRDTGGRIVVVADGGVSVADSNDPGGTPRDFSTRPEIAAALDGERTSGARASATLGADLLYVALPVTSGGTVHGAVRITYPTSTVDARIRSTWIRLAALSAVVLGLVAAVGVVFAAGVTRPVRRLRQASGRLADGDLAARVDTSGGPPELRALGETFNTTADRLARVIDAQHRFVADASHQLRTPLTALRLRLETLAPHVTEQARPKLDAAIAETDRLGRLVHSLLLLARLDAASIDPVAADLSAAVAERIDAWAPVAAERGVRIRARCGDVEHVLAIAGALEQILDNLLANAIDASPAGTEIVVSVDPTDDATELHVVDRGPGMDATTRARAFERFWRPTGEPSDRTGTGFGLGLAIVSQLAAQSGGTARLEAGPDGVGLDAIVRLRRPGARSENLHPALTFP
jgi:signal transduction histidine kinase